MIVHCPSCDASNDVPSTRLGAGGAVIGCSLCGHEWIEACATEIGLDLTGADTGPDIQHLMLAARRAQETFSAQRRQRQAKAAAWVVLLLFALSPLLAALVFPERVVAAAPASIVLYDWLGRDVNIYGLDIRRFTVEHLNVDGRRVIAVKGELSNISGTDRKLPWLRFGLRDESHTELYSWQLDTGAQVLRPGESRTFATKLASPPETASKVEIRFARADEIGSNAMP